MEQDGWTKLVGIFAILGAIAAILVVPEVRRLLRLERTLSDSLSGTKQPPDKSEYKDAQQTLGNDQTIIVRSKEGLQLFNRALRIAFLGALLGGLWAFFMLTNASTSHYFWQVFLGILGIGFLAGFSVAFSKIEVDAIIYYEDKKQFMSNLEREMNNLGYKKQGVGHNLIYLKRAQPAIKISFAQHSATIMISGSKSLVKDTIHEIKQLREDHLI